MLRASHAIAARTFPGEIESGDSPVVLNADGQVLAPSARLLLGLIDGAGHGPDAARAAAAACAYLMQHWTRCVSALLEGLHSVLAGTRCAVAALAAVDLASGILEYGGVGNVEGRLLRADGTSTRLISYRGLLGATFPRVRTSIQALTPGDLLVLHSDGVSAQWDPNRYPGLCVETPALVADILLREWGRQTDDATVLVARFDDEGARRAP